MEIKKRIGLLRAQLETENLAAYYISGTDPHVSEYLPARWKTREYITGFTGSYGEVLITCSEAMLWTDSRYFIQAGNQLEGTGVSMQKLRVPDAVTFDDWIVNNLTPGDKVGVNPQCLPYATYKNLKRKFSKAGIEIVMCGDLLDKIWGNRPSIPKDNIFELDVKYAGLPRGDKFKQIESGLERKAADYHIITKLDDLAWAFNLRGSDVEYNPVFVGFGLVGNNKRLLFADKVKFDYDIIKSLENDGVEILPYNSFYNYLPEISNKKFFIEPESTNLAIVKALEGKNEIVEGLSIPTNLKAIKNPTELEGFKKAMRKDGVALVKFHYWLGNNIGKPGITEYDVGRKLAEFRAGQDGFRGESFPPIVGYRGHGAIVHLVVGKKNANQIEADGLLLFDSGGHYLEGTTDITRTVAVGPVTQQQKTDFTLALKGVIALSEVIFPYGTKGCHIDIMARKAMWDNGLNYGHGTGHGVGHYLAVHEGPMAIRQEYNPNNIVPGMVMSNEPALYREGQYGIRTENMMVCVEKFETGFGKFLGFETLTLCPIDLKCICRELLTNQEIGWINKYHKRVREELGPLLDNGLKKYLESVTAEF